jgi:hypothetical protein
MKFMITWKIPTASYKVAAERFLSTGALDVAGMKTLGRWHAPASYAGWHLVEGDPVAVAELSGLHATHETKPSPALRCLPQGGHSYLIYPPRA